ncbi:AAC(3) family N-acetyltransferase [Chondrinema litorale]|uniref:AAC(3) family N-acetyltransferase n=1 Tax=Chondrinema litorale TaxID=2994555 RepID=UPI002543443D|nr:AAC(3) family N-acetyltransferase [Chondrinema litorale]UZR94715.1 AAC(3) family N-acetyltransferase [Chondrinema litorale]
MLTPTLAVDLAEKISMQLKLTGLQEGDIVMLHASLKSLSRIPQHPKTVIDGVIKAIGKGGTLLVPSLTYDIVNKENPVFDRQETPSNVGAISEYFRTMPGTYRSLSPTHSVCGIGRDAKALLEKHHLDNTPVGENSPFRLLPKYGGKILFIGCGLKPNTSMHAVEELLEPPYLFEDYVNFKIVSNGSAMDKLVRRHNFKGYEQRYDRVANLLSKRELKKGRVLSAEVFLIDAVALWEKAYLKLRENPLYFVDKLDKVN